MHDTIKKVVSWFILILSKESKLFRKLLKPYGLRTKTKIYQDGACKIYLVNNKTAKLTNLDKNWLSFELYWKGRQYYEPITMLLFRELLKEIDIFLDIGSNIGYYSIVAASENKKIKIISFEPNPKLYSILKENKKINGFHNICCEPIGVSNVNKIIRLYIAKSDMSASLKEGFRECIKTISVNAVSLDKYLKQGIGKRILIKLDIEGHEPKAIKGAINILKNHKPDILLEVIQDYDSKTLKIFKDCGYSFYQITNSGFHKKNRLLKPTKDTNYKFLNYLITSKKEYDVNRIFNKLKKQIQSIDLKQTSIYRNDF
jgi:FkbM family methyltransferase